MNVFNINGRLEPGNTSSDFGVIIWMLPCIFKLSIDGGSDKCRLAESHLVIANGKDRA